MCEKEQYKTNVMSNTKNAISQSLMEESRATSDYIDRHLVAALVQHSIAIEISDEEIEKAAEDWQEFRQGAGKQSFEEGAKWYREQLKQRQ
jgi:hypothetical protein